MFDCSSPGDLYCSVPLVTVNASTLAKSKTTCDHYDFRWFSKSVPAADQWRISFHRDSAMRKYEHRHTELRKFRGSFAVLKVACHTSSTFFSGCTSKLHIAAKPCDISKNLHPLRPAIRKDRKNHLLSPLDRTSVVTQSLASSLLWIIL